MEISVIRRQGDFTVDASFEGTPSGVTALYGTSGSGKTSIINMVAGLVRPEEGRIAVNGLCLFDSQKGIDLPPERRRVGYVFQDGRLLPHLSVRGNLTYGMKLVPRKQRMVDFDTVVDLLGIGDLLHRRPNRLSGGEKQRVAIGRALLTSPAMLLMDEPLASLDPVRKAEVLPFIMKLSREFALPILYVSHQMEEILNLADRLVLLDKGRVMAAGDLEDLLSRQELQQYMGEDEHGSVLSTVVEEPSDAAGLTLLRFGDHILKVAPVNMPRGTPVRVRIASWNVGIALEYPKGTSFQNIFFGTVESVADEGAFFVDLLLDVGRPLWARITRESYRDLSITQGKPVYALIKSATVSLGMFDKISREIILPPPPQHHPP
jgi:molybdate transport system ATP-binding protein